jgi:hypothetical protein
MHRLFKRSAASDVKVDKDRKLVHQWRLLAAPEAIGTRFRPDGAAVELSGILRYTGIDLRGP